MQEAARDEADRDDSHCLLCIVAAMAKTIRCGRKKLSDTENTINTPHGNAMKDPVHDHHQSKAEHHSNSRRQNNETKRLKPAFRLENTGYSTRTEVPRVRRESGPRVSAYERVRTRCRQPKIPGDQIPRDRA